jgi:lambda repressor-like predicted transcriptional regulator
MDKARTVTDWMAERGIALEQLLAASGLEKKVLQAIIDGRYTPSPQHRRRVAAALDVNPNQVLWGHTTQVDHMYGHGPQFGRSP